MMDWSDFRGLILDNLSDDLLSSKYRKMKQLGVPMTFGHCYVASEAAYHLLGGKENGWTPHFVRHLKQPHWFLKHESGFILDLTWNQFKSPIDYAKSRGIGFLTKEPSKRTKKLIKRIAESKAWSKLKNSHGG